MNRQIIPAGPKSGNTRDIINALARALPVAVAQIEARKYQRPIGNIVHVARKIGELTRRRFKYVKDGLTFQDIKLPSALEETKTGDCKSLSLYIAANLTALGIKNGLRFAAYGTRDVTHVYNWYLDEKNNLHILDACLEGLKESPNYTKIEDMQTRIIAGVPVLSEFSEINGPEIGRRRRNRGGGGGGGRGAKKLTLAPARGAFLALVAINFRNLATRQAQLMQKNPNDLKGFWLKLGGDYNKLVDAINKGKSKRPTFGKGKRVNGIGEDAPSAEGGDTLKTIEKFLPFVGPILTAISALFKKNKIEDAGTVAPDEVENLGNFEAADAETNEARAVTKTTPGTTAAPSAFGFKINPLLIAGGLAAAYVLTRKKGRK